MLSWSLHAASAALAWVMAAIMGAERRRQCRTGVRQGGRWAFRTRPARGVGARLSLPCGTGPPACGLRPQACRAAGETPPAAAGGHRGAPRRIPGRASRNAQEGAGGAGSAHGDSDRRRTALPPNPPGMPRHTAVGMRTGGQTLARGDPRVLRGKGALFWRAAARTVAGGAAAVEVAPGARADRARVWIANGLDRWAGRGFPPTADRSPAGRVQCRAPDRAGGPAPGPLGGARRAGRTRGAPASLS